MNKIFSKNKFLTFNNIKYASIILLIAFILGIFLYYIPLRNANRFLHDFDEENRKNGFVLVYSEEPNIIDILNPWRWKLPHKRIYARQNNQFNFLIRMDNRRVLTKKCMLRICNLSEKNNCKFQTTEKYVLFNVVNNTKSDTVFFDLFSFENMNKEALYKSNKLENWRYRESWLARDSNGDLTEKFIYDGKDVITPIGFHEMEFLFELDKK
jgi:hypothetical protein